MKDATITMTPAQLLAKECYAVCRFVDGDFAWMAETFSSRDRAERSAKSLRDGTKGDYRVVRIMHER